MFFARRAVLVVLTGWAGVALADVAPEPLATGGTSLSARPKSVPVALLWEEVDLRPSPGENEVTAVFALKNTGDREVEFEVGFPSYFGAKLRDFRAEVDGEAQASVLKKESRGGRKKLFLYWMCWTMKFPAGNERRVRVSYRVKTERAFSKLHVDNLPADLKAKIWAYESGYVLRTGAGWSGRIGRAEIRIHYGKEVRRDWVLARKPEKGWIYDPESDRDVLVLQDFEPGPSHDIAYAFKLCDAAGEAALLDGALKEKKLDPWAQQYLLERVEAEENPLKLSPEEKSRRVLEILEWMLPPKGPAWDQKEISRGAEGVLHRAYGRLWSLYRERGREESARTLSEPYLAFLKVMLDRDVKWKGHPGRVGKVYGALEAEHGKVSEFLSEKAK